MKTAFDVAQYFLALVDEESGDLISNLKLQKLLFYAEGLHRALYDRPLFGDKIIAWNHGPVVVDLYHEYSKYGSGAIPVPENFDASAFTEEESEVIEEINRAFGQFSAWKLRNMTHEESPWKETPQNQEITLSKIAAYFKTQLIRDAEE